MIRINGVNATEEFKHLPGIALSMFSDELKYWSNSALIDLYVGLNEQAIELAEQERSTATTNKGKLTSFINRTKKKIAVFQTKAEKLGRDQLFDLLYEEILKTNNCQRLTGFGFTNQFGDNIKGNSEYHFNK